MEFKKKRNGGNMKTRSNSKSSLDESKVVKYLLIGTGITLLACETKKKLL